MTIQYSTLKTNPNEDGNGPDLKHRQGRLNEKGAEGWVLKTTVAIGNIVIDTFARNAE